MNAHEYSLCMGKELDSWRGRLAMEVARIDVLPSIEKYKLTPYIEGLHILLAEMEERIAELGGHGRIDISAGMVMHAPVVEKAACNFKECEGVRYDYDFGG